MRVGLGFFFLLGAMLSTGHAAKACPRWMLLPFSAEKVQQALESLSIPGPRGSLTFKVEEIRPVREGSERKEAHFKIYEAGNPTPVGSGWRLIDPAAYPLVYPPMGSIELDASIQKNKIGSHYFRTLFEIAPPGALLEIVSTNEVTNAAFIEQIEQYLLQRPLPYTGEIESYLNFLLHFDLISGHGPLWPRVLHRVGWRRVMVHVQGSPEGWGFTLTAKKPD